MNLADLNGNLAIFGGVSGVLLLSYMVWVGYWTRQKSKDVQAVLVALAKLEGKVDGFLLGRKR